MKPKTSLLLALVLTLALSFPPTPAQAASQGQFAATDLDLVFVIDVSGSMPYSDRQNFVAEAVKWFVDTLPQQGNNLGLVAFNTAIVREQALLPMESPADRDYLKEVVGSLDREGDTDIPLALAEAQRLLDKGGAAGHQPVIILLTDGQNDISGSNRTEADLAQDLEAVLASGYHIFCVGLNSNGSVNQDYLDLISEATNGQTFITDDAGKLPFIYSQIMQTLLGGDASALNTLNLLPDPQITYISIPDPYVAEAQIMAFSISGVEIRVIDDQEGDITDSPAVSVDDHATYSVVRVQNPEKGALMFSLSGQANEEAVISYQLSYDIGYSLQAEPAADGEPWRFALQLLHREQPITDPDFLGQIEASLRLTDSPQAPLKMELAEGRYTCAGQVGDSKELVIEVESPLFVYHSQPVEILAHVQPDSSSPPAAAADGSPWLAYGAGVLVLAAVGLLIIRSRRRAPSAAATHSGQLSVRVKPAGAGAFQPARFFALRQLGKSANLGQLLADAKLCPELSSITISGFGHSSLRIAYVPGSSDRTRPYLLKNGKNMLREKDDQLETGTPVLIGFADYDIQIELQYYNQ